MDYKSSRKNSFCSQMSIYEQLAQTARAAVTLPRRSPLLGLSSAQTILPSPSSSTFTVPSSHYKQAHIMCAHKPFLQLFRLDHKMKLTRILSGHFYEK